MSLKQVYASAKVYDSEPTQFVVMCESGQGDSIDIEKLFSTYKTLSARGKPIPDALVKVIINRIGVQLFRDIVEGN